MRRRSWSAARRVSRSRSRRLFLMAARTTSGFWRMKAMSSMGDARVTMPPVPRHIARWDLDKTYLRTEFDTLRDLVKTALERPDEKRANPGASTLMREMVRADVSVHILSGSPEQMRRRLEHKLRLDGIQWDSVTLKPNLENILRFRFRAVKDQLGYKLPALLRARAALAGHEEP